MPMPGASGRCPFDHHTALAWPAPYHASEFAVVASEDDTDVTYTPTVDTTAGDTAGTAKTVSLDKGQALPVSSTAGDLTGTPITSTKPVSVFAGQQCANIPSTGYGYCDHIVEQIPPTAAWGKEFLTVPLKTRTKGDTFRMLASEDGTTLTVAGVAVATLDRGQVHQMSISERSTVSADKAILVAQYSNGSSHDSVTS